MAVIEEHPRQSEMCIYIGEASPFGTPNRTLKVADKYVGLVIGKQSETIKNIATQTNTKIFIPQKPLGGNYAREGDGIRTVELCGSEDGCQEAENRIQELIEMHKERQANKEKAEYTPSNFVRSASRNFSQQASNVSNFDDGITRSFYRQDSHNNQN